MAPAPAAFCQTGLSAAGIEGRPKSAQPVSFSGADRDRLFTELQQDVAAMERELSIYKRVVQLMAPSVVHVEATPLSSFRMAEDVEEAGSGVLVRIGDRDFVLTNRHVVRHSDVEHIRLELADGRQLRPTRIESDHETDVAVLFVEADDLTPARIGDSDAMEIGDVVMAFGSPFNLRQSVTRGIISGKGRVNLDLDDGGVHYQNFMQTDAAINPGNSGGPLVNLRGEVIGLNTAIASNSGGNDGIGFSIPINIAVSIMRQLVERGTVQFGFLGVTLDGYFDARAAQSFGLPRLTGARVKQVSPGSPAALAGIAVDDVILRFNGTPIENDRHLISLVKLSEIGRKVELVVLRDRQYLTIATSIGRLEDFMAAPAARR
ncbi:MAG TPA: trypsin-like peptidase domain-containing protein [Lacipirellulaceae bacterium]|nr:trypsin-like peptidase domain-containing protein [Lacipirellulaceae bacterium]